LNRQQELLNLRRKIAQADNLRDPGPAYPHLDRDLRIVLCSTFIDRLFDLVRQHERLDDGRQARGLAARGGTPSERHPRWPDLDVDLSVHLSLLTRWRVALRIRPRLASA